jgi:hypothetical protein
MDVEFAYTLGLKVVWESRRMDWIQLTQDKYWERDIAISEMKLLDIYRAEIFLNSLTTMK